MWFQEKHTQVRTILLEIAGIAGLLWEKGWAERNAGNISVDITHFFHNLTTGGLEENITSFVPLNRSYPFISGHYFLVTGTGKRMRDLSGDPENNVLAIEMNDRGDGYFMHSLSPGAMPCLPTSEWPSHLAIHNQLNEKGSREKAVLHTHATDLIVLTQNRELCDENRLNEIFWGMHPETKIFLPEGAGFVPYLLPGTEAIAEATLLKFQKHRAVIWEKHGCFAIGKDASEAFDLIDTLSKSASIYLKCRSAGFEPEGFSAGQLDELLKLSGKFIAS